MRISDWSSDVCSSDLRKLRYGDVVTDAAKLTLDAEPPLKTPAEWTFLGKAAPSKLHIPEVVTGRAVFGLDVKLPGMVHAALMQAPVPGGSLKSNQPKAAIGRAACRERVWKYVYVSGAGVTLKKKQNVKER